jgi:hypothetical protein
MLQSPIDIALVTGVFLLIFGPPGPKSPWRWKPETYEKNLNSPVDPFALKKDDLFFNKEKDQNK